mmetsp:Transcript_23555/g.53748  ORF Transcript_23555/g.53748 Transcript_23555/m.53748 type:complete len:99 (-) Transcript_23555:1468-1764(-)
MRNIPRFQTPDDNSATASPLLSISAAPAHPLSLFVKNPRISSTIVRNTTRLFGPRGLAHTSRPTMRNPSTSAFPFLCALDIAGGGTVRPQQIKQVLLI